MDLLQQYHDLYERNDELKLWKQSIGTRNLRFFCDDPVYKNLEELIFEFTLYINFNTVLTTIKTNLKKLNVKSCYLFFPLNYPFKPGSESALTLECYDLLQKFDIKGLLTGESDILSTIFEPDDKILIIDDCIYTGLNGCHIIKTFDSLANVKNINFLFITCASSIVGKQTISDSCIKSGFSCRFYHDFTPLSIREATFLKISDVSDPETQKDILWQYLCQLFPESYNFYMIYFDHKVHNAYENMYTKNHFDAGKYPLSIPSTIIKNIHLKINGHVSSISSAI